MKKIELLAPAGSMDSLMAALNAGCDAVYLSGYMFGARSYAPNFSEEELKEAIKICHLYGVKIYVTVNTLIYDEEAETLINYIDFLHQNSVDAIIIQDLGMMDLIRKTFPDLELHASTQMHIHNMDGVKFAKQCGLKRVVLARETDIDTRKKIRKEVDIEIECFVHGALCISYSGQCLMSSLIGGRSGNRGSCAGSCRLPYKLVSNSKTINDEDYILSTKDLNTLEHIGDLIESGVDSFKIEGRMKRSEYVYFVVSLYRKAIDSYSENGIVNITSQDIYNLKKIFNREFTKGFLFHEDNNNIINSYRPNHLGIEIGHVIDYNHGIVKVKLKDSVCVQDGIRIIGKEDTGCTLINMRIGNKNVKAASMGDVITFYLKDEVAVGSKVLKTTDNNQLKEIKKLIDSNLRKVIIDAKITLKIGTFSKLELRDGINKIEATGSIVEKSKTSPLNIDSIKEQVNKLGNTVFKINNLEIELDDNIFISIANLNQLRRDAIKLLEEKRIYKTSYKKCQYDIDIKDFPVENKLNVLINSIEDYNFIKEKNVDTIYCEKDLFDIIKSDKRVVLKTPRVIEKYNDQNMLIGEAGGLIHNCYGVDFSLNVTNSYTVAFLHSLGVSKVTLSYEMTDEKIKRLIANYYNRYHKHPNLELIIYAKEEIMISKYNMLERYNLKNQSYLVDKYNNYYPIMVKNDLMYIYNCNIRKLENINNYYKMGINSLRIQLLDNADVKSNYVNILLK